VAKLFRTTESTVRYWRHVNRGPTSFKIGRRVLYDPADIEAYMEAERLRQRRDNAPTA
jgi:hypothetical protein